MSVQPEQAVLTCFKLAEDDGLVARVWSCFYEHVDARVTVDGLGNVQAAAQTDHLERDQGELVLDDGSVHIPVAARGIASSRLVME